MLDLWRDKTSVDLKCGEDTIHFANHLNVSKNRATVGVPHTGVKNIFLANHACCIQMLNLRLDKHFLLRPMHGNATDLYRDSIWNVLKRQWWL